MIFKFLLFLPLLAVAGSGLLKEITISAIVDPVLFVTFDLKDKLYKIFLRN